MEFLWIIPVRQGSKGLPGKNARIVYGGKSLLEWCIQQSQASQARSDLCVSTDCPILAEQARRLEVPVIMRPEQLARDESSTLSVVDHALLNQGLHQKVDAVGVLQVTSPLRLAADIDAAIHLFESGSWDSLIGVTSHVGTHPAKMYTQQDGLMRPVLERAEQCRRQDLPSIWRRNGAMYLTSVRSFVDSRHLWGGRLGCLEFPEDRSLDVDNQQDLDAARHYIETNISKFIQ